MICRDKIGAELQAGDFIVYGHALGRSAGLKIGRILEIKAGPPDRPYWRNEHEPAPPTWRIRVLGLDDRWGAKPSLQRLTRGTLQFPDRCCLVRGEDLPENVRLVLSEVQS